MKATGHFFPAVLLFFVVFFKGSGSWPEGTYGLPMPELGCPLASGFDWHEGHRTQETEKGSHATDNVHLFGIKSTADNPTDRITSNFCMKISYAADSKFTWQKGRYCIYKKDACPFGFRDGWIYWDDSVFLIGKADVQDYGGALPDGSYDKNTQIHYCCRHDGYAHHPIKLPNESPFYLLRYGDHCQKVEGMDVSEEWVYWAGVETINWDNEGGTHPAVDRSSYYPKVFTMLFYCYYTPAAPSTRLKTVLTIAYVIAGVAAFIVLILIAICLVQRCPIRKQTETDHNAEASLHESMLPAETSVIYRPGAKPVVETHTVAAGSEAERGAGDGASPVNGYCMEVQPLNSGAPSLEPDPRPISMPPSYDEVMARVNSVEG